MWKSFEKSLRARAVYCRLEKVYNLSGGRCAVDSAFSMKQYQFLVKSSDKNPFTENPQDFLRRV
jgi:hypothetical protein